MTASATGYDLDVRAVHHAAAPPDRVWRALLAIADWWPHRFRPGASAVSFEARLGGAFAEIWPDGGGALYGVVTRLEPTRSLTVDGPMGMAGPVVGRWTAELTPDGDGTVITVTHRVLGPVGDDTRTGYEAGWTEALALLAAEAASP